MPGARCAPQISHPLPHTPHARPVPPQRGLIGEIIKRFEQKGFKLVGLRLLNVEKGLAERHYADLSSKPFFPALVEYICSGPVVAMVRMGLLLGYCWEGLLLLYSCEGARINVANTQVWEGKGVVLTGRKIIGATNPAASEPGTIRGDYAIEVGRNIIHGSDSVENANKEIALW
jgi:nucleoside-diphosphate kinase